MKDFSLNKLNKNIFYSALEAQKEEKLEAKPDTINNVVSMEIEDLSKYIQEKNTIKAPYRDLSDEQVEAMISKEETSFLDKVACGIQLIKDILSPFTPDIAVSEKDGTGSIGLNLSSKEQTYTFNKGDSLDIVVNHNGKTLNYSITSDRNQDVKFELWDDGRLVINGSSLSITTAENQYSDVMLLGYSNSLATGKGGKTHVGNNIYYSKTEGNSNVTKWGDDEPEVLPNNEGYVYDESGISDSNKIILTRKNTDEDSATDSANRTLNPNEKILVTLTNPFTGENYKYTIKNIGKESHKASFEFLLNGRLLITGDYLEICAADNQQDDIILDGEYCTLYTGNENDIVRNGYVIDDANYIYLKSYKSNNIYTGSGDDYFKGYLNPYYSEVDLGAGYDKASTVYSNGKGFFKNAELVMNSTDKSDTNIDYIDGWGSQGSVGDCQIFSLINSLGGCTNNTDLSKYITVVEKDDTYQVTFKNYEPTGTNKNMVEFSKDDFLNYNGAYKDIDTRLFDYAINELIHINYPHLDKGDNSYWVALMKDVDIEVYRGILSEYILGKSDSVSYNFQNWNSKTSVEDYTDIYLALWELYKKNKISNLNFAFNSYNTHPATSDYNVSRIVSHAFAVKNIDFTPDGTFYIELVNPWDDSDVTRFSGDYIFKYSNSMSIYGYSSDDIINLISELITTSETNDLSASESNIVQSTQTVEELMNTIVVPELLSVESNPFAKGFGKKAFI